MAKVSYTVQKTQFVDIELEEIEVINLAIHVIERAFDIPYTAKIDGKNLVHTEIEGLFPHIKKYRKATKKDKEIIKLRKKLYDIKHQIWEIRHEN